MIMSLRCIAILFARAAPQWLLKGSTRAHSQQHANTLNTLAAKVRPKNARLASGLLVAAGIYAFWKAGKVLPGVSSAAIASSNFKSVRFFVQPCDGLLPGGEG